MAKIPNDVVLALATVRNAADELSRTYSVQGDTPENRELRKQAKEKFIAAVELYDTLEESNLTPIELAERQLKFWFGDGEPDVDKEIDDARNLSDSGKLHNMVLFARKVQALYQHYKKASAGLPAEPLEWVPRHKLDEALAELKAWHDLRDVSTNIFPGDGSGLEIDPTPDSIRAHLKHFIDKEDSWYHEAKALGEFKTKVSAGFGSLAPAGTWLGEIFMKIWNAENRDVATDIGMLHGQQINEKGLWIGDREIRTQLQEICKSLPELAKKAGDWTTLPVDSSVVQKLVSFLFTEGKEDPTENWRGGK